MNNYKYLLLLFLLVPVSAHSQSNSGDFQNLLKQLRSFIPAQREAAEKTLIQLGPQPGVALPDSNQPGLPADVKIRLERIRKAWDSHSSQSYLKAETVHNTTDSTLSEWFKTVQKETGNSIDFSRVLPKTLDSPFIPLNSTEFWSALDEITQKYQLKYSWFERPKAVRIQPGGTGLPPSVLYKGPFRLELTEWGTTIRPTDPENSTIRTGLILAWEPRLRPIYFDFLSKMQYSDGTIVSGESLQILGGEGCAKPLDFIFPLPCSGEKKPVALQGDFSVVIAGEGRIFPFSVAENPQFPISLRQDEAHVALKSLRRTDKNTVAVQIAIEFDQSHSALRSYMTWLNSNKAFLILSDGTKRESSDWETVWQSERGAEVRYFFPVDSGLTIRQVEYFSPTAIKKIDYSFSFEGIFSDNPSPLLQKPL